MSVGGALRPSAGALRLIAPRTATPGVDIADYARAVTAHCPYLAPSLDRGLTGWTLYEAVGAPVDVEAEVFHAAVQAAEWVRPLAVRAHGALVCENVAILGAGWEVLQWPHWALKHLYGPVGLMIGKFAAGEERTDHNDRSIPPPPVSFLPVRAAVRPRDGRFLQRTPNLSADVASARDDGRDVFSHIGHDWKEIRLWAQHLPSRQ
ncbi:hypothetical protein [Streptomyces sp. 769]|uniref:hypothetical protein n=1 Tax=Streptomyces sp. 769 TaxID=1262452 RepID=UPI00057F6FD1|nr:hypothetical protein [Streptomyces sp. 769]